MIFETAYSLDDILLKPQHSNINSRLDTDVSSRITNHYTNKIPLLATNMSSVSEYRMMLAMWRLGGSAALHRFLSIDKGVNIIKKASLAGIKPIIASIGVGDNELFRAKKYIDNGADIILIDVAHGDCNNVEKTYSILRKEFPDIDYIIGNIATKEATERFLSLGVNGLRVGIGGGRSCATRQVTGHGVPNLTALLETTKVRNDYYDATKNYVPIIIDGGIRNSGDVVKALYFGADIACLGYLLAGTAETPNKTNITEQGLQKKFYGMASKEAQDTHRGGMKEGTAAEGYSMVVPYKGPVRWVIEELVGGVRSGLTYSGARSIKELRENGKPLLLTDAAKRESKLW